MSIFQNHVIDKKQVKQLLSRTFNEFGLLKAAYLAQDLKDLGFRYATQAGLSVSIEQLRVPPAKKDMVRRATNRVNKAEMDLEGGLVTEVERFQNIIYTWANTSEHLKNALVFYFKTYDPLNSVYMMAFSGARGNLSQVRQLVGMRGLMANPSGDLIDLPIITNFREGLTVTDYIISSYGARKGLVDTALRTADSGYLTRRLIDVAQDMITRERNCKTRAGIWVVPLFNEDNEVKTPVHERVVGRLLASPIVDIQTGDIWGHSNLEITLALSQKLKQQKIDIVHVRSPLTCGSMRAVCQYCYGWNLAYGRLIDLGEAVGIIAAQSIGEPGTQLTMRTFHTGGVFNAELSRQVRAEVSGQVLFPKNMNPIEVRTNYGQVAYTSQLNSFLRIVDYQYQPFDIPVTATTVILVKHRQFIGTEHIMFEFFPSSEDNEIRSKTIKFKNAGEIVVEQSSTQPPIYHYSELGKKLANCCLWVLKGEVYQFPTKAQLTYLNPLVGLDSAQVATCALMCISQGQITLGNLQAILGKPQVKITNLEIYHDENSLAEIFVYLQDKMGEEKMQALVYGSYNWRLHLKTDPEDLSLPANLGSLFNLEFQTPTGGYLYPSPVFRNKCEIWPEYDLYQMKIGGTIFYIPEARYVVSYETPIFLHPGREVEIGEELYPNCLSKLAGFFDVIDTDDSIRQLVIQPGQRIELENDSLVFSYDHQIFYPGEQLLDNFEIQNLCLSEVRYLENQIFVYLLPIVRYEILSYEHSRLPFSPVPIVTPNSQSLVFGKLKRLFRDYIYSFTPVQMVEQLIRFTAEVRKTVISCKYESEDSMDQSKRFRLILLEQIIPARYLYKEFAKVNTQTNIFVHHHQYVEPYVRLSEFDIRSKQVGQVVTLKKQEKNRQCRILMSQTEDFETVFAEQPFLTRWKKTFFRKKDILSPMYHYRGQGLALTQMGNSICFQKAIGYLVTQGGTVERFPGELVNLGENFAQQTFEITKTGDIVQGLPKIEEIFEARKPKTRAFIARRPGIILKMRRDNLETKIWLANNKIRVITIPLEYRVMVNNWELLQVGQPIGDELIYHQDLLEAYNDYYYKVQKIRGYNAAYRSFRKIQNVLIRAVQTIYQSQGVNIADKHLEIIIKQMTTKVEILEGGETPLLPEELVDLTQVYFMSQSTRACKDFAFKPIILGITKASLKTPSFISAASFQYTTRILGEAAIHGKVDWLRGLKENVIVGRLIPAGTGFHGFMDMSTRLVRIPSQFTKRKRTPQPRQKYRNLQRKKFQIGEKPLSYKKGGKL